MKAKKKMISVFSGAGGLDCGLHYAGFDNRLCIELDADSRHSLHSNFPKWNLSEPGDVHLIEPREILKQAKIKAGELDLLAGGPPCQPFSKSAFWAHGETSRLKDPRAKTLHAYINIVKELKPKVLLLENVLGISYSGKDEGLELLKSKLKQINKNEGTNYIPKILHINAASYGVPQTRERIFIVASRSGELLKLPEETHISPDKIVAKNQEAYLSAWDAIGDLDVDIWPSELNPSGKWADLLPSIPEGQNYLWHTEKSGGLPIFGWRSRYWSFLLKLSKSKPSWTIQAQPGPATGPFHWKSRLLSVPEMSRLQTFPKHYIFCGERRSIQRQIGNAVPPAIGELLGLEVRRQFFNERVRKKLRLIPSKRSACPEPEKVKRVRKKFKNLVGQHDEHPGVGKGPGARKRVLNN